ncbi:HAMP domain-containing histidine kinase [Desulfosporosinus fructosivorans]|uniref:histidine kinase n=1 Tax=Desulfosporosinus fructosivorans TaxID=2018669 RepID=A0A4Z0QYA6_9FIRM|nr:HAMP domain-containing sensor histidine kinase [Desulfosporosinus fructosivorans]TGE35791.1 HAMP domain-containing histidine kinase [Desulfosporosinus fructosivorans]
MKSMIKILVRYVASAAAVALILLILNLAVLIVWTVQASGMQTTEYHISEIADSLTKQEDSFVLSETGKEAILEGYHWAMLLNDNGTVIWNENLPEDLPRSYTVSDVASFSRWYLYDYPVHVWQHSEGLLVLGSAKNSAWKQGMEIPEIVMKNVSTWFFGVLILNSIAAVILALLFGTRLLRSLRPLVKGIEDMAEKQPVALLTGGLLGDLATKLNQTSAQLQRQEVVLQKRDNARTTWVAGVSHDIRTPLSIVMGYASQLEDNPHLPQAEREQARIIRRQSEKIKALVSDLNLASKLEYDMQPLRPTSINMAALVRGVVVDFLNSGLDDSYSIDLNVENDAQQAVLIGDEKLLRRAVSNLMDNSIRHNPDGCTVTVTVTATVTVTVTVTVDKSSTNCSITVSDNGAGIPPEVLENLNNPKNPAELRSHGLGLTIVRQITKAHGGTSEFKNLSGDGCLVVLRLPIIAAKPEALLEMTK